MKVSILLVLILLFSSCVSSKEYKARLSEIEGLKVSVSQLEQTTKEKEAQNKALEEELSGLKRNYEELKKERDNLLEDNANLRYLLEAKKDELSKAITDLRAKVSEKEQRIRELEQEITRLSEEKARALEEKERAIAELKGTYNRLVAELQEEIKKGEIEVTQLRDKLTLSMVEKILFDSGSAEIKREGKKVLDRVFEILKNVKDRQINIEGHTDNVPISPRLAHRFPTNWELSTARATNVVRYLQERGIDPSVLSATGYAEYRPVASNETEEGRAKNRRIEIVLVPLELKKLE
ncbi:MAG: OmpA family protein [Thermodesulfovibrionales bacterium]|nr:OmpA family protein [Thermodesulfovibrionales bacterium]